MKATGKSKTDWGILFAVAVTVQVVILVVIKTASNPVVKAPQVAADPHEAKTEARWKAIEWVTNNANDPASVKIWKTVGIRDPDSALNVFHIDFTATNGFGGPSRNVFGLVISDTGSVIEVKDEQSGKLYVSNGLGH
jgi:hypothetical protein